MVAASLAGCSYSLPLGSPSIGRGRPLGQGIAHFGMSAGPLAEMATALDSVQRPQPAFPFFSPLDSLTTWYGGGFDVFSLSVGVTESIDVGYSLSRGLHSLVRVAGGPNWNVALSPAFYWYSSGSESSGSPRASVRNANLTVQASVNPFPESWRQPDLYAGGSVARYRAHLEIGSDATDHGATVPTAFVGFRMAGRRPGTRPEPQDTPPATLGIEAQGAWIRRSDDALEFIPTMRVYFSFYFDMRRFTEPQTLGPPRR
jgi:hypothetical protein